jgi:hypothetical protein
LRYDISKAINITFSNKSFSPAEVHFIIERLRLAERLGYIKKRKENNQYLIISFSGVEEKGITPKWNIKIYIYNKKKKSHSIVCVDSHILKLLVEKRYENFTPPRLEVLKIDDAGWGFPLCGVMVGVSDEKIVKTATVPVEYFRNDTKNSFHSKKYLKKYATLAIELVRKFGATPKTHRIEICTGYINQPLREMLRTLGFDVRVVEIKGLLQDELENIYKKYVFETIGADIYYDPKEMKKSDIPKAYYRCLRYGMKNYPDQVKTGWESINEIQSIVK